MRTRNSIVVVTGLVTAFSVSLFALYWLLSVPHRAWFTPRFAGDGTLFSRGLCGYVLDLGPMDLGREARYQHSFTGLRRRSMNISVLIDRNESAASHISSSVHMELRTQSGIVLAFGGPLDDWLESNLCGFPTRTHVAFTQAHESRGVFLPQTDVTYYLTTTVHPGHLPDGIESRLIIHESPIFDLP